MTDEIDIASIARRAKTALSAKAYREKYERLDYFVPSAKQALAINCPEKFLYVKAANQSGKSTCMAAWISYQVLGRFPVGYTGWRPPTTLTIERPNSLVIWVLAPTSQMARDGMQSRLLGDVAGGRIGTGLIPLDAIVGNPQMSRGIAGAVDSVSIRRDDGTSAVVRWKTYEQGREALQAESVDIVVCDEMLAEISLWNELIARTTATSGVIRLCATPLRQQSPIAQWFKEPGHPERATVTMTADETSHLTDAQREAMKAAYTPLELATRYYGADWAGGGAVFSTPAAQVVEAAPDLTNLPAYWRYLIGIDFSHGGLSDSASPFACVSCAYDPLSRVVHVFDAFKLKGQLPEMHVSRIMQSPIYDAPVAWPHDGNQGQMTGETYAGTYRRLGLKMRPEHSTFDTGGYAVEPGLDLLEGMMAKGLLKVSKHLVDWWEEFESYERDEEGRIIKRNDHLLDATRVACMSIRFARPIDYDNRTAPTLYRGRDASDPRATFRGAPSPVAQGVDFDVWTGA